MVRKPKFSKEIKIKACEEYKSGKGSLVSIAKSIGIGHATVRQWYLTYQIYGDKAFEIYTHNRTYTKEFKQSVINERILSETSLADLSAKHNISTSVIRRWIKKYYNGIEIKNYKPRGDIYTMKSRKTTHKERVEIVEWVINNNMNYKEAASLNGIKYALVYQWVQKYISNGPDALRLKKRGPNKKHSIAEESLSEIEKLKLELERERQLRKCAELRLEIHKKKEQFEEKLRFRK